jgi:hypothetical protein
MQTFHKVHLKTLQDVSRRARMAGADRLTTRRAKLAAIRIMVAGHARATAFKAACDVLSGAHAPIQKEGV